MYVLGIGKQRLLRLVTYIESVLTLIICRNVQII